MLTEKDVGKRAYRTYCDLIKTYPTGHTQDLLKITGPPVQRRIGTRAVHWHLPVLCVCGKSFEVSVGHFRSRHTVSCGCKKTRVAASNRTPERLAMKRLKVAYNGMMQRCSDKRNVHYGAKGIEVCAEWKGSVDAFVKWALKSGYAPGLSLDRIDPTKGYSPDNCRYVDTKTNSNNRSTSRLYAFNGMSKTLSEWCYLTRKDYATVYQRVETYGWDISRALETATRDPDDSPLVYLAFRKSDGVLTVGRTASFKLRFKKLSTEGFSCIARYTCANATLMGQLEVLFHDWLDKNGVRRGVGSKSKGSKRSWETFRTADAVASQFRFRKLCQELEKRAQGESSVARHNSLMEDWLSSFGLEFNFTDGVYQFSNSKLAVTTQPLTPVKARTSDLRLKSKRLHEQYKLNGMTLLFVDPGTLDTKKEATTHWIRHKLGLVGKLCNARDCTFQVEQSDEVWCFYERYHLQGPTAGHHFSLRHGGSVVACMSFSKSAPERKKSMSPGCFNLVRFAAAGSVPGAASKLFVNAVESLKADQVVTYSDNRYADGRIYEMLGFVLAGEIEPDYRVWHPSKGVNHKSHWQRRVLPVRLQELGINTQFDPKTDLRSEYDIEELCGCSHAWDCGKKKWTWHAQNSR